MVRRDFEMRSRNRAGEAVGKEKKEAGAASSASSHITLTDDVSSVSHRNPSLRETAGLWRIRPPRQPGQSEVGEGGGRWAIDLSIWILFRLRLSNDSSKQSSPFTALFHHGRRRRRHRGGRGRSPSEAPLGRLHPDSALRGVARHIASHELCQGESRGTEATIAQER